LCVCAVRVSECLEQSQGEKSRGGGEPVDSSPDYSIFCSCVWEVYLIKTW
jgi:hypothetical protein